MKRISNFVRYRDSGADIDSAMTPMIDVVFLLLVFFVWTVSFQLVEQVLQSELSSQIGAEPSLLQEPPPEADFDNVVVKIGWDGTRANWQINERQLASIDAVQQQLSMIAGIKADAPVILDPTGSVPLGHVIEAYDVSKRAGFAEVSFAIEPDRS